MKKKIALAMSLILGFCVSTPVWGKELVKRDSNIIELDIEAESGNTNGSVKVESGFSWASGQKKVGWFKDNESNNLILKANNIPEDYLYDMDIVFESGETRHLCYKVNNGDKKVIYPLNSGAWNKPSVQQEKIELKKGENEIKFFADSSLGYGQHGANIDKIILRREMSIRMQLKVKIDEAQEFLNNSIVGDNQGEYPENAVEKLKQDINSAKSLYNDENTDDSKYQEAINALILGITTFKSSVNRGDSRPNPSEKEGYRLIFEDNFDGEKLDESKWVNSYLTSWASNPEKAKPVYKMKDGKLSLILNEDTEPWCPEFDGDTRVTGFMTGDRSGLHNWTGNNTVLNPTEKNITNINKYGYYEMRAKMQVGGGMHTAWWMTGFEDKPEQSAEVDIFEILGRNPNEIQSTKHAWKDPNIKKEHLSFTPKNVDLANEFHNYGLKWTPEEMIFYFDGQEYGRMKSDIDYPMTMLISFYEKRGPSWTGPFDPSIPYPKTFDIDYVRIYKEIPRGYENIKEDSLEIISQDEQVIDVIPGEYEIVNNEIKGTPSWVTLRYNDGTDTQQWVKWEPITEEIEKKLNIPGSEFYIEGEIMGLAYNLINGRKAKLKVKVLGETVSPVKNFLAESVNKNSIKVKWNSPETVGGLEGYVLFKDGKKVAEISQNNLEHTFKNLNRHTIYNFKIAAKYSNGVLSSKESVTVRTLR
ncbi:family 16 glycosylhydrolase [Clostridium perfringens]|uniref:Glycosyl hydrolase family protein n=1 Tax=Clostridium perfringens TaxID=1502 RepID=A0AAE8FSL2_CLOPF|nr:family 16 glycosylhydrolase [Clostridium perfringens]MDK3000125.1 family 16 glycosylhydrolase [Clostridium perfringens]RQN24956.1 glycosyl hydrolase family protein [Clostridium perfringens]